MSDRTITVTFCPTVRQLAMMERLETDCGVSLHKIIQRAAAKGLDQMYIDRYGPQTEPWFSIDDDSDGIPVPSRPGEVEVMPQIVMVELTDDQADALRQLAGHWRESPDDILHRIVADGFECAKLRPDGPTISQALAKDDDDITF